MRNRRAFFSFALVAAAGFVHPAAARAGGYNRDSCSSFAPSFTVVEGPCPVSNPSTPACSGAGEWTGIKYQNTGSVADNLATLVTRNNQVSVATGNQVYDPCKGDPLTDLGERSCHEQAVKINPADQTVAFWIVAKGLVGKGQRLPIETSIAAKKGSCIKSFPITGLGLEGPSVFQTTKKNETVVFKGCAVTFELNPVTGEVLSAANDPDKSDPNVNCSDLIISDVGNLSISITGVGDLGSGQFGDGYISSGTASCMTRVIGGKLYTWGSPCPN